jgi:hypothetical protein
LNSFIIQKKEIYGMRKLELIKIKKRRKKREYQLNQWKNI